MKRDGGAIDICAAHRRHCTATQCVWRNGADHRAVVAEMGEPDRDIRLGPADVERQRRRLHQQLIAGRGQADQQFAEEDKAAGHGAMLAREPAAVDGEDMALDIVRRRRGEEDRRATDVAEEVEGELPAAFEKLSPRQLEVARLVSKGKTNYQIACELGITENTVKLYVSQVLRLTHMHNRTQLALALTPSSSPVHQRFTTH